MLTKRILISGVATLAVAAGLLLAQTGNTTPGATRAQTFLDRIATYLNLTDTQKSQMQAILNTSLAQAKPLMQQMRQDHTAMETLIKSGAAGADFDAQLQKLAADEGNLTSQLVTIRGKGLAQAWALLTPDQRTKASELRNLFRGMGPGMMGPGMMGRHGMGGHRHGPPAQAQ